MEVKLLTTHEHLSAMEHNAAYAMLTCRANTDKLQNEPAHSFIERAIKAEHGTILEHITLTYEVNGLSRACLQELARHRHISLSVESTRHTLKEKLLSDETLVELFETFSDIIPSITMICFSDVAKSLGLELKTAEKKFIRYDALLLFLLRYMAEKGKTVSENDDINSIPNDELKYYIPEFWPTNLVLTANVRELRHIVKLRTNPAALAEFQGLAKKFVEVVPDEFKYLFEGCVYKNE